MEFGISLFSLVETADDVREYMGISYIKAFLNKKGLNCDARVICKDEMDEVLSSYSEFPQLIGISIYCNTQELVKLFCKKIKDISADCHIILGGAHVLGYEKDILSRMPLVDSICTGDGEESMYEVAQRLMNGESLLDCLGITFRKNNEIIQNEKRPDIMDLNQLPYPYRERNPKNKKRYFYITGSRGCMGRCTFCAEFKTGGCGVRIRNHVDIVDEMEYLWRQYGTNKFHFTDATFEDPGDAGIDRAEKIFNEIIRRKLKFRLVMYTRTNIVNKMSDIYYDLAYEAGVECFFVGVESGNLHDLKLYGKGITVEDNLNAIKKILSHNIYVNYGFICFNPYSTYETIQANLEFLFRSGLVYNSYHILSKMTIMPQSAMKDKFIKDNLVEEFHFDSDRKCYKFVQPEIESMYFLLYDSVKTEHLIDYDSQIAIDRINYQKKDSTLYDENIEKIFYEIGEIWKIRNEYLYRFFSKAIQLHKKFGSSEPFINYIQNNLIHKYDIKIKKLYLKYNLIYAKLISKGE